MKSHEMNKEHKEGTNLQIDLDSAKQDLIIDKLKELTDQRWDFKEGKFESNLILQPAHAPMRYSWLRILKVLDARQFLSVQHETISTVQQLKKYNLLISSQGRDLNYHKLFVEIRNITEFLSIDAEKLKKEMHEANDILRKILGSNEGIFTFLTGTKADIHPDYCEYLEAIGCLKIDKITTGNIITITDFDLIKLKLLQKEVEAVSLRDICIRYINRDENKPADEQVFLSAKKAQHSNYNSNLTLFYDKNDVGIEIDQINNVCLNSNVKNR